MTWQTLAELAKEYAALPKERFAQRFDTPFLLEVNPELGDVVASDDTRSFDPARVQVDPMPTLARSLIINFARTGNYVLGRGPQAELRCKHETVSDAHCQFERFGSLWSIRDSGSKNGTFLSGRRLGPDEQAPLKFGSKIQAGEAQFLFLGPDDTYDLLQDLVKEPRIRPRSLGKYRAEFKAFENMEAARAELPGPFLVVQAPKGREGEGGPVTTNTVTLSQAELKAGVDTNVSDAVFNLSGHDLVRIGRASVTQIHLPLGAVSNLHCALIRDGERWFIQDLGAKNGTYVWGERLGEERRELASGSEITFGNIKSIFFSLEDLITYATHRDTLV